MTVRALKEKKSTVWPSNYLTTHSSHESESPQCPVLQKMTFHIPHVSYCKYPYTHEMCKVAIKRQTLREIPPYQRESYSFLERNLCSLFSFPLPLLYPLKGDLYPNPTHIYLECRECFGAQETLGIFQKKPVRLGGCNRAYYGIWKAIENMTP